MSLYRVLSLCGVCIFLAASVYAEKVILKSGEIIVGSIREQTEEYIEIDFEGIGLTYYRDDIEAIEDEAEGDALGVSFKKVAPPVEDSAPENIGKDVPVIDDGDILSDEDMQNIKDLENVQEAAPIQEEAEGLMENAAEDLEMLAAEAEDIVVVDGSLAGDEPEAVAEVVEILEEQVNFKDDTSDLDISSTEEMEVKAVEAEEPVVVDESLPGDELEADMEIEVFEEEIEEEIVEEIEEEIVEEIVEEIMEAELDATDTAEKEIEAIDQALPDMETIEAETNMPYPPEEEKQEDVEDAEDISSLKEETGEVLQESGQAPMEVQPAQEVIQEVKEAEGAAFKVQKIKDLAEQNNQLMEERVNAMTEGF